MNILITGAAGGTGRELTNGPRRTLYRHGHNIGSKILTVNISRPSAAECMTKQLRDTKYVYKPPGVAY